MNPQMLALLLGNQVQQPSVADSLSSSIQAASDALRRRQEAENNLPQNVPINNAKTTLNNSAADLVNNIAGQRGIQATFPAFMGQMQDEDKRKGSILEAIVQGVSSGKLAPGYLGQAYAIANQLKSNAGLENLYSSNPQADANQQQLGRLTQMQQALGLTSPQQYNDPQLLNTLLGNIPQTVGVGLQAGATQNSGKAAAISQLLGNQMTADATTGAARLQALGNVGSAQAGAQGNIAAAKVKGMSDVDVARINKGLGGLSEDTQKAIDKNTTDYANALQNLGQLADRFKGDGSNDNDYYKQVSAAINNLNESLYGKGNFETDKTSGSHILGYHVPLTGESPDVARQRLADNLTMARIKLQLNNELVQAARTQGITLPKSGTKAYGELLDGILKKVPPQQFQQELKNTYNNNPSIAPDNYHPPSGMLQHYSTDAIQNYAKQMGWI